MFNKVAIIGVGLLGGSLAKELRRHALAQHIVGVCRSSSTADIALKEQVVDAVQPLSDAVCDADLVVIATPMQTMLAIIDAMQAHINPSTIITDVGSVKTDLYNSLQETAPQLLSQFVLAHPIAGAQYSGVQAATLDLFTNKHLIITQTDEVAASAVHKIRQLWCEIGAKVVQMSLSEHDKIFAKTSHLPHVIAFALVNYLNAQSEREKLFDLAAAGFYDFTRIASSDAYMWRDICMTNQAEVLAALDGFRDQIDAVRAWVAQGEQQQTLDYFKQAKVARDQGLEQKALNKSHQPSSK